MTRLVGKIISGGETGVDHGELSLPSKTVYRLVAGVLKTGRQRVFPLACLLRHYPFLKDDR